MRYLERKPVKSVKGRMETGSLDELIENMMLFKDMFYKNYSEEEIEGLPGVLRADVQNLEAFQETQKDGELKTVAWIGMAWK